MREIEFRAWDNVRKILVTQENVDNLSEFDEDGYGPYYGDEWFPAKKILGIFEYFQDIVRDERFVVEQFTGLLDKNGTKIFEGDILRRQGYFDLTVYYERASFYVTHMSSIQGNPLTESTAELFEVIGTIHDNPDLWEGEVEE